ncbi:hypothetical protein [Marinomonas sp.]
MPRRPRLSIPGYAEHLIQRGHNRQPIFACNEDIKAYAHWLREYAGMDFPDFTCHWAEQKNSCAVFIEHGFSIKWVISYSKIFVSVQIKAWR